jgi:tripartite-type tricarboxylate transporter receptor subunit TctC
MLKPIAVFSRIALVITTMMYSGHAVADDYPSQDLTLIVPYSAGGGTDLMGRVYAENLSKHLGQTVIVDNRVGAGSTIGTAAVSHAAPDGYTLLFNGSSLTFHPGLFQSLPYDLKKDLKPIAILAGQSFVLYANRDFPANNIEELVAIAKKSPGTIPYASVGVGSSAHLASELLWDKLGIKLSHIPFPGTPQAMNDLLAGEVDLLYTTISGGADMLRAGKVKALGISGAQRSPVLPDLPTIAEQGLPGYTFTSWLAIFVPSATPDDVVAKLAKATEQVVADPEVRAQFEAQGLDVQSSTPESAEKFFVEEIDRWTKTIHAVGIDPQ